MTSSNYTIPSIVSTVTHPQVLLSDLKEAHQYLIATTTTDSTSTTTSTSDDGNGNPSASTNGAGGKGGLSATQLSTAIDRLETTLSLALLASTSTTITPPSTTTAASTGVIGFAQLVNAFKDV